MNEMVKKTRWAGRPLVHNRLNSKIEASTAGSRCFSSETFFFTKVKTWDINKYDYNIIPHGNNNVLYFLFIIISVIRCYTKR